MLNEINAEIERLSDEGKYGEAIPLAKRALAIVEQAFGPDHPEVATNLNNLALFYCLNGDYTKAEPLLQRALMIREKALGPDHLLVANSLNSLALLYYDKGNYTRSELLYQRSLAIREQALGPDHPDVATVLNNLALLYWMKDDYAKAEPFYQRVLAIDEKTLSPNHPNVALSLNNLAELYRAKGDYVKAEPLHQRALTIRERALDPDHPDVAQSLNNLALLYYTKGNYAEAEPLLQRALTTYEKVLGPNHPNVALSLNNLAELYQAKGDCAKAEPLYQRALTIREKAFGSDHLDVARSLNHLAELYQAKGDYGKAEPFYQRALAIDEKALGPNHPAVAPSLNNLAGIYYMEGDYAKAELLHQRALTIREKAFGPDHLDVAQSLNNLALLYEAQGDVTQAIALCLRAANISEHNIALSLATGSERQRLLYLATFLGETHQTISLHVQFAPHDQAAQRLAFTTILRRKGRVLDATADSIGALRRRLNPQDGELLDQFTNTHSRLATFVLGGLSQIDLAQYRAEIMHLEEQVEQLETQISARSAEFRAQSQPITLEAIQSAIPPDAVLVEFFSYYPLDAKGNNVGAQSYVAYVMGNQGEPAWIELGEAAEIDNLVDELRVALRLEDNKPLSDIEHEVKPHARLLDQKIMQPVRKLLGDKHTLLISPDGVLNLIPFAALVDEQGKYLIESYSLIYLTTGRDLLRLQTKMENKQGATIFANPDFDAVPVAASSRGCAAINNSRNPAGDNSTSAISADIASRNASLPIDFSKVSFRSLPGTADEAQELRDLFPDAVLWTQAQATKTRLKQVSAPALLHIATHGFFFDDVVVSAAEVQNRGMFVRTSQPGEITAPEFHVEDPLLRSGLAFAGANLHRGGDDDGILTAKEASGLNLWGTKLVVLSACDTGVGEVMNGEGVYGLRRALVLAGSETQVISLWSVSDTGTCDLMIDYYKGLQAGQGRSEALRQVQLHMLKSEDHKHPYYWASFIQSGEWANLDGRR